MHHFFWVDSFLTPCQTDETLCLALKKEGSDLYGAEPNDIEDFEYSMGFTYQLEIESFQDVNPSTGEQVLRRRLVQELSKEEAAEGTDYWINLDGKSVPITKIDEQYYLQGHPFTCHAMLDCDSFLLFDTVDEWTLENIALTLTFRYVGGGVIELQGGGFIN